MTNSNDDGAPRPQAEVAGDLDGAGTLNGRAGASVFSIGGPDGRGGTAVGANPYELLSASLAACTAMTIRLQALRRKIPLSRVKVAVSYHHGRDGGRDSFERSIKEVGEAPDKFRRLASELMAKTVAIPGYHFWGWLRVIRPFKQVIRARGALFGLSNTLHRANWERKVALAREVASALKITEVDAELLTPPKGDEQ